MTRTEIHIDIYNKRLADKANKQAFNDAIHQMEAVANAIVHLNQQLKDVETATENVFEASLDNLCQLTEQLVKDSNNIDLQLKFTEFCS